MNRSFVGCLGKLSNGYSPVTSQRVNTKVSNFLIEMGSAALAVETSTGNKETRIFVIKWAALLLRLLRFYRKF